MATLSELEIDGVVSRYDPQLGPAIQEQRCIYGCPQFQTFVMEKLPTLASKWTSQETPAEQVDAVLAEFCAGNPMQVGTPLKILRPIEHGVWEIKTADVRIFGWFYRSDCFIATNGNDALLIKKHGLYKGYIDESLRIRSSLNLDLPKFVSGSSLDDVVSDHRYP